MKEVRRFPFDQGADLVFRTDGDEYYVVIDYGGLFETVYKVDKEEFEDVIRQMEEEERQQKQQRQKRRKDKEQENEDDEKRGKGGREDEEDGEEEELDLDEIIRRAKKALEGEIKHNMKVIGGEGGCIRFLWRDSKGEGSGEDGESDSQVQETIGELSVDDLGDILKEWKDTDFSGEPKITSTPDGKLINPEQSKQGKRRV